MNRKLFRRLLAAGAISIGALQAAPSVRAAPASRTACVFEAPLVKARCANPRGMRLSVRSYFYVTNSADGAYDNTVEAYGAVFFNGQRAWYINRDRAIDAVDDATDRDRRKRIYFSARTYDVYFNDPATWKLRVAGYLHDRDRGSKDDLMWRVNPLPRVIDIKDAYEQQKAGRQAFTFIAGDHDSESADLRFVITKSSDLY